MRRRIWVRVQSSFTSIDCEAALQRPFYGALQVVSGLYGKIGILYVWDWLLIDGCLLIVEFGAAKRFQELRALEGFLVTVQLVLAKKPSSVFFQTWKRFAESRFTKLRGKLLLRSYCQQYILAERFYAHVKIMRELAFAVY